MYLSRTESETLAAVAEAVLPEVAAVPPDEVAARVDAYLDAFDARRKWIVKLAMWGLLVFPLAFGRPPLTRLALPRRRAFLERRFTRAVRARRLKTLAGYVRAMIRLGQQMAYLGYYSDERSFAGTGYEPFSRRERAAEALAGRPPVPRRVTTLPHDGVPGRLDEDVVIVGSGAAGAVLAHRLTRAGRSVLVLERGRHVEPADFSEDEVHQITTLYADGALQLTRDFSFQVLQGACVGGTTVVNNAVCFDLPGRVLRAWNAEHGAGLDEARLREAHARVRTDLHVDTQPPEALYAGAQRFVEGARAVGWDQPPRELMVVEANVVGCPGSGYCNIGCPFGAKLSMLDTLLPEAQREGLRILARCTAEKVRQLPQGAEVEARLEPEGRKVRVRARTVVLAAGTIASSWLLLRSRLGGDRVGHGLSFNMGSPITADFAEEQCSYDGLQITHYLRPPEGEGFMLETWFNPVVSQALNMPGWFADHARNMGRYRHLAAAGALVGTRADGRITRALTGGPDLVFTPAREDVERLVGALKVVARMYLAAGALRVMPNTYEYREYTRPEQLDELDVLVEDASDLAVGTGHPQGGNALGTVVGPDFRVRGTRDVFCCDASVFPTSVTVNPQLTVMALADLAAPGIAAAA